MTTDFRRLVDLSRRERRAWAGCGGMGTMLQRAGLATGSSPEVWNLDRPETVLEVHTAYVAAGASWLVTNTFGGTRERLALCGRAADMKAVNAAGVALARTASTEIPVLASVGPTGEWDARRWQHAFEAQVEALTGAGVDGFLVETIVSLEEGTAAVRAAVQAGAGPVIACFTPGPNGYLLDGSTPEEAAERWTRAGAAIVGVNCGGGPDTLLAPARRLVAAGLAPVLAAPNAGLPEMRGGTAAYRLQPDAFARAAIQFQDTGVRFVAGCCGTGPEHLREAVRALSGAPWEE